MINNFYKKLQKLIEIIKMYINVIQRQKKNTKDLNKI